MTVTVPDEEQLGQLTVYKEGEVLTGADVTENGTTFRYEKRRQKGAVYNVMPEQILQLLMVQKFTVKVIW